MNDIVKPDYVHTPADLLGISGSLAIITKDCADLLEKHYEGWLWVLNPDEQAGMLYIYSLRLSGEFGYKMKIADVQNDPTRKLAIAAGGEILERYGIKRGKYKRELLKGKIQDLRGNFIPDLTDGSQRDQKRERDRVVTKAMAEGAIQFKSEDRVLDDGSVHRELYMKIGDDNVD